MPDGPPVMVEVVRRDPDDLPEAERHDRQVVAAQPQGGPTDHDAGDTAATMTTGTVASSGQPYRVARTPLT